MGVHGFWSAKIKNEQKKYPQLTKGPRTQNLSVMIDCNGLIHYSASLAYGYADSKSKQYREAQQRQKEMLLEFQESQIEADLEYEVEILKSDPLIFKEWKRLTGSKLRSHKKMTLQEEQNYKDFIRPQVTGEKSDRSTFLYKKILGKIYSEHLFDYFVEVFKANLEDIMKRFKPKMLLYIAVDGSVPIAKVKQQRTRRFKKSEINTQESILDKPNQYYKFNSSAEISPGTPWMFKLDSVIREWVVKTSKSPWSPREIKYSSFLEPGEGEHKLISFMRNGFTKYDQMSGMSNVIIGKDADLIFLSLLSPVNNIYINREDAYDFVNINALKSVLLEQTGYSENHVFDDFAIMSMLIGNDFLPSVYLFKDVKLSLDLFIDVYRRSGTLTKNREIDWYGIYKFIRILNRDYSKELTSDILNGDWFYPPQILESAVIDGVLDYDIFSNNWYANALLPRNTQALTKFIENGMNLSISDTDIQKMCYEYLRGIHWVWKYYTTDYARRDYVYTWYYAPLLENIENSLALFLRKPEDLPMDVLYSYKYIKRYDPTTGEYFKDFSKGNYRDDKTLTCFQQLSMVLPPKANRMYVPEKLSLKALTKLQDMLPENAEVEYDTIRKNSEYMGILFLPLVDIERVITTLRSRDLSYQDQVNFNRSPGLHRYKNYKKPRPAIDRNLGGNEEVGAGIGVQVETVLEESTKA